MTKEKRTIRQVPLPRGRRGKVEPDEEALVYEEQDSFSNNELPPSDRGWSRIFLWSAAFVFLILLGFALATGFSGATVTVTPKTALIEVNHEFVATKEGASSSLRLETLELRETAEREIPAEVSKQVTEKASGKIVVYNTFSTKSQRLIKNTRFATPEGLIYRINESTIVPGLKKDSSEKVIPGSIEVTVFGDAPGEDYNIGLTDFTIPGFKTDPARYSAFYARSKTIMSGGVDGVIKTPTDVALATARIELQNELQATLREQAKISVPEEFVLYDQALIINYESVPLEVKDDVAKVKQIAVGTAYILKRTELERAIAKETLSTHSDLPITLPQLSTLHLEFNEPPSSDKTALSLRFKLSGSLRAIWLFNEDELRSALLGKQRSELASALSTFPTIEKVDLVLRPFWSRSFPTNPKKVNVVKSPVSEVPTVPALDSTGN